jgi:hypothetical protein
LKIINSQQFQIQLEIVLIYKLLIFQIINSHQFQIQLEIVLTSNILKTIIPFGITDELEMWIDQHPEKVVTDTRGIKYFTIPKSTLEKMVPETTIMKLRIKLGKDQFGMSVYDGPNITNMYLGVDGKVLIIHSGMETCNMMYDSDDLNVSRYFTEALMFDLLCMDLDKNTKYTVYKYEM